MRAPQPDAKPYGWVIEFPVLRDKQVAFIPNDGEHDRAYVEQRAADLHGQWRAVNLEPAQP